MELHGGKPRVCLFDSGIGGIGLLLKCVRLLPCADFFYFADNANVPYGARTQEEILSLAQGAFARIAAYEPDAAVIACNTVTAIAARSLRQEYPFPIVGIQPAVKPALREHATCAVLATPATVQSASVQALIERFGRERVRLIACPGLAEGVERGILSRGKTDVSGWLPPLDAQSVVLGCTHYGFAAEEIAAFYRLPVYDGLDGTANRLLSVLPPAACNPEERGKVRFIGGDERKNAAVFSFYARQNGGEGRLVDGFPKKF